jgi:hypothetical protein
MKTPEVKLKNLKYFQGHDGMQGMNADIYIDGVKCMHVHDGAYGGCFEYYDYAHNNPKGDEIKSLIKKLDDHIKTLPARTREFGGKKMTIKVDLDWFVTELEEAMAKEKAQKKMMRQMADKILVGVPDADRYSYYSFKIPLAQIPKGQLQAAVFRIKGKLNKGEQILNTNLTALGITI